MNGGAIFWDVRALKEEAMADWRGRRSVEMERFGENEGLPKLRDRICNGE